MTIFEKRKTKTNPAKRETSDMMDDCRGKDGGDFATADEWVLFADN